MKSRKRIICDNLFTLFNFLNFAIAGLLFAVGAYKNMLFLGVIILNIIIGTAQELKARKLVEELSLLNRPSVRLFADGREHAAALEDLKQGDVMILQSGDQICADAEIVSGTLEVNESLLTGESDAIVKDTGSGVLSGSSVISGKAYARVLRAGEDSYTAKLSSEVKKIKQAESELLGSMKKVTKFTSFLIIPLGILLFLEAFVMRSELVDSAILSSSAALLGMLPKGLVLLISVSLAAGVIRLAKMKILVQNIYSLETLAHVDVLCLDKTGTLTDGNLKVHSVIPATSVYEPGAHGIGQREGGSKQSKDGKIHVADLTIEPENWRAWKGDKELHLPNREFELLRFLAENPNIVFSKETLFEKIWGYDYVSDAATVSVHINRLREKIEEDARNPQIIETIWGVGYRLNG